MNFKETLETLKPVDDIEQIDIVSEGKVINIIPNAPGKSGSLQIYANLVGFDNGNIDFSLAQKGLEYFGEHVAEAKANPGAHPNIDLLLNIKEDDYLKAVVHYKIPGDLKQRVEKYTLLKKEGRLNEDKEGALATFNEVMDLLEAGKLRTAQIVEGKWQANQWVKNGIMLGFPLGDIVVYNGSSDINFTDKATFPVRKLTGNEGFRVVPPAAGLRRGAFAGSGCVFMPPGYANVGAHVGAGTMVENLAGSCAQVGKDSHISAGAIIGGVLDPVEATPVIIGDHVLLGEGSGVTQGTRLGDLVTLAPGVHLSKATPVLDPINNVAYTSTGTAELISHELGGGVKTYSVGKVIEAKDPGYGPEVPAGALVIPSLSVSSQGTLKLTPLIAKYIKSPSERAYALEEALRG
jgi:2,3,4,5-tetrahydropyridine-2,6-dicarboxylate N-succinyltransferase